MSKTTKKIPRPPITHTTQQKRLRKAHPTMLKKKNIITAALATLTAFTLTGCMASQTVYFVNTQGLVHAEEFSIASSISGWEGITPETPINVNLISEGGFETGETETKTPNSFEYFQKTISEEFFTNINPNKKNLYGKSDCYYGGSGNLYFMFCGAEVQPYPVSTLFTGDITRTFFDIKIDEETTVNVEGFKIVGALNSDYKLQYDTLQEYKNFNEPVKTQFIESGGVDDEGNPVPDTPTSVITLVFEGGYIHEAKGKGVTTEFEGSQQLDYLEIDLNQYDGSEVEITVIFDYASAISPDATVVSPTLEPTVDAGATVTLAALISGLIIVLTLIFFSIIQLYKRNKKSFTVKTEPEENLAQKTRATKTQKKKPSSSAQKTTQKPSTTKTSGKGTTPAKKTIKTSPSAVKKKKPSEDLS